MALRDATQAEHGATEDAFALFDLTRRGHYRAFLTAHAMALPRFELAVTGQGWSGWQPRLPALADDLAALHAPLPAPMIAPRVSPVAAWGVQYVIEGSRLGGRLLSERIPQGAPSFYLSASPDMSVRWQAFCSALERAGAEEGPAWLDEVTNAAIETFRVFRRAADVAAAQAFAEDNL
ncbi:hypothetical protein AB433_15240 [Croceicoccus naphthovorans]|uniref:Heme oxygenase n=2 Tax=Croceicoccus naphthovorans TaxID=1348774 RepID=A0A0G3XMN0_9SPHN|nr:hypothetical protein AB433_15240 [Croceicoccus naphthovorans]